MEYLDEYKTGARLISLLFMAVFLSPFILAHASMSNGDAYVRVVSANPDNNTYTLSCSMDPENNYLRDWFIRPDSGDFSNYLPNEAEILDQPSRSNITYTFKTNGFYHIGCVIVNSSNYSQEFRGDLHIDLRNQTWNPEIVPVSGDTLTSTLQCNYNPSVSDSSISWEVLDASTGNVTNLGTGKVITDSVTNHGLYDYVCHVNTGNGTISTGLPIEYFDQGAPYFPDNKGVPYGIENIWLRNSNSTSTNSTNPTNSTNTNSTNTNSTNTNSTSSNQTGLFISNDNGLTPEFTCKPNGSSDSLSVDWNFGDGNFIYDTQNVLSHSYSSSGLYYVQCDVWDNINAKYTPLSEYFTFNGNATNSTNSTNTNSTNTNSTNSTVDNTYLHDPLWLSHSGTTDVSPTYFHLEIQDPNNLTLYNSTDWEIRNLSGEVVWAFYNASVGSDKIHVHTPDGVFMNSLSGQSQLDYNTTYNAMVRFRDDSGNYTNWVPRVFTTALPPVLNSTNPTWTTVPGFNVERFSTGLDIPVMVAAAPQNLYLGVPESERPFLYVTELYGKIKVIYENGNSSVYANNLLNFDPFGSITGGGQMGLVGLYVEPDTGDIYAGMVYIDHADNDSIKSKIVKFTTSADGKNFTSQQTIIDNIPSAPSHQIQDITMHNGRLYVGLGDALTPSNAQNDTALEGKIISMYPNGTDVQIYAKGFRNPFGQDWSSSGILYTTDNAPDVNDRLVKVTQGENYGWGLNDNFSTFNSKRIATLNVSPVDVQFNYDYNFSSDLYGRLYVAVGGPIYQQGPTNGKEILEFTLNSTGDVVSRRNFVTYTGTGYGTPIGLAFQNGSMFFTDIYGEPGFTGLGQTEANIYKVSLGNQTGNQSVGPFRAGLSIIPWYPKDTGTDIEYIFECDGIDGSGNYKYNFDYGDGDMAYNYDFNRFYHKYPYGNINYTISCTVKDQTTFENVSKSIVINPSDFIGGG